MNQTQIQPETGIQILQDHFFLLPGESRNLKQSTINQIKWTIADHEGRLVEDISDSEVWEYVEDMQAASQLTDTELTFQEAVSYSISYFAPSTYC